VGDHSRRGDRGAEAIDKLVALMRGVVTVEIDNKPVEMPVPPITQLGAANALLDRGYGLPDNPSSCLAGTARLSMMRRARLRLLRAALLPLESGF
jgi:hypothetical protein